MAPPANSHTMAVMRETEQSFAEIYGPNPGQRDAHHQRGAALALGSALPGARRRGQPFDGSNEPVTSRERVRLLRGRRRGTRVVI